MHLHETKTATKNGKNAVQDNLKEIKLSEISKANTRQTLTIREKGSKATSEGLKRTRDGKANKDKDEDKDKGTKRKKKTGKGTQVRKSLTRSLHAIARRMHMRHALQGRELG